MEKSVVFFFAHVVLCFVSKGVLGVIRTCLNIPASGQGLPLGDAEEVEAPLRGGGSAVALPREASDGRG